MQLQTFYFNLFRECTYLLSNGNGDAIVIDCGCSDVKEQQRFEQYVASSSSSLSIKYHLLTHAHIDHVCGARFVYEKYGVLPILSEKDSWLFSNLREQAAAFGVPLNDAPLSEFIAVESLADADMQLHLQMSETEECIVKVIPTPGHSEGSVCYLFSDDNLLFSGDTLFQNGFGRTDLPGGDFHKLLESLGRLSALDDNLCVLPGHGYSTTIQQERHFIEKFI